MTIAIANVLGGAVVSMRRGWSEQLLRYFVAVGAGFMLAAVILETLPHASELGREAFGLVLGGYLLVHLFEHTVAPHFHFGEETHHHVHLDPRTSLSALLGLGVHSFFDGLSIGSAFLVEQRLGILLFVAILLHKAPEGFAIASVVLSARGTRKQALGASCAIGAMSVLGGLAIFAAEGLAARALAVSAGATLYVAATDLVPEVNKEEGTDTALAVIAGVLLFYATVQLLVVAGI